MSEEFTSEELESIDELDTLTIEDSPSVTENIRSNVKIQLQVTLNQFLCGMKEMKAFGFGKYQSTNKNDYKNLLCIFEIMTCALKSLSLVTQNPKSSDETPKIHSIREVYYEIDTLHPQLSFEPQDISQALNVICNYFKWGRNVLPIESARPGQMFFGTKAFITVKDRNGKVMIFSNAVSNNSVVDIPLMRNIVGWETIDSNANFIIFIESNSIYLALKRDEFFNKYPYSIALITQGNPSFAIRYFGYRLHLLKVNRNPIQVYYFGDSDGYGLCIGSLVGFGAYSPSVVKNQRSFMVENLIPLFFTEPAPESMFTWRDKEDKDVRALEITYERLQLHHLPDDVESSATHTDKWMKIWRSMNKSRKVLQHKGIPNPVEAISSHLYFKGGVYDETEFEDVEMLSASQEQ